MQNDYDPCIWIPICWWPSELQAKRTRERTPTPGEYCGPRGMHGDEFCFPQLHVHLDALLPVVDIVSVGCLICLVAWILAQLIIPRLTLADTMGYVFLVLQWCHPRLIHSHHSCSSWFTGTLFHVTRGFSMNIVWLSCFTLEISQSPGRMGISGCRWFVLRLSDLSCSMIFLLAVALLRFL